jgi:hypothetical protein
MKSETLYVVLGDDWYVSRKGTEFIASPDKREAQKVNLQLANNLFRQLQSMGYDAKIEFAEDAP